MPEAVSQAIALTQLTRYLEVLLDRLIHPLILWLTAGAKKFVSVWPMVNRGSSASLKRSTISGSIMSQLLATSLEKSWSSRIVRCGRLSNWCLSGWVTVEVDHSTSHIVRSSADTHDGLWLVRTWSARILISFDVLRVDLTSSGLVSYVTVFLLMVLAFELGSTLELYC
jgi:hypothetical protein